MDTMEIINSIKQTATPVLARVFNSWHSKETIRSIITYGLALILIAAGITKLINSSGFIAALQQVSFLNYSLILWMATLLPILELALAAALIFKWRSPLILPAVTLLFAAFLGFSFYGWIGGLNGDCGCFGSLVRSSFGVGEVIRDFIFFCAAIFLWVQQRL